MHGIGAEQMVEIARRRAVDRHAARSDGFRQPDFRVLGRQQADDTPVPVCEGGFDGMAAENAHEAVVDVASSHRRLAAMTRRGRPVGAAFRASAGTAARMSAGALCPRASSAKVCGLTYPPGCLSWSRVLQVAGKPPTSDPYGFSPAFPIDIGGRITIRTALPCRSASAGRFCLIGRVESRWRIATGETGLPDWHGEVPEWLKGTDCKSVGFAYAGSNPALSTNCPNDIPKVLKNAVLLPRGKVASARVGLRALGVPVACRGSGSSSVS